MFIYNFLKRVANGDLGKTSSLPVRSDRTAKEFGELKLISGDHHPVIEILELLKFGVWQILMWGIREHFRRYAHALRFAIGVHGA